MLHPLPYQRFDRSRQSSPAPRPAARAAPRRRDALRAAAALMLLSLVGPGPAAAADPLPGQPSLAAQLGGKTLSAVAYIKSPPGAAGGLQRLMLQAYLAPDGSSLVRQWASARNSYSPPLRTRWSLSDDVLCIGLSSGPLCAKVHVWGPRIAGLGTRPYAMLDGDLQPGNAIGRAR